MKTRTKGFFAAALLAFVLLPAACGLMKDSREILSGELGIDAAGGTVVTELDTHGGNGDGTSFLALKFSGGGGVLTQIQENDSWRALPAGETVRTLMYGIPGEVTPYIYDGDGNALFPEIRNGYYCLLDRSQEAEEGEDAENILKRASLNFTLGVYDTDTDTLYLCRVDT